MPSTLWWKIHSFSMLVLITLCIKFGDIKTNEIDTRPQRVPWMYLESDAKRKKCSPQNIPQVFSCNKASVFVVKLVEGCLIIINDTKSYFLQKNSQSQIKQPGTPIYVPLLKSYLCSFCCFWNHSSPHHWPNPRRPTEVQDRIFLHGQHISCALQVIWNIEQRYAVKYVFSKLLWHTLW